MSEEEYERMTNVSFNSLVSLKLLVYKYYIDILFKIALKKLI